MSRFAANHDTGPKLAAAALWASRALVDDGSVLSDQDLWTVSNLDELDRDFVQVPDLGPGTYSEKLERQLSSCGPQTVRLAAEMQWVLMLCPSNITPEIKRDQVRKVWGWSGQPVPDSELLNDEYLDGIGSSGTSFNTNRWREFAYLINFTRHFKKLDRNGRKSLIEDRKKLSEWLRDLPENESRQFRHMLIYLLHPDECERAFSSGHRVDIVSAFTGQKKRQVKQLSSTELDDQLLQIRLAQEAEFPGIELDFYDTPLGELWMDDFEVKTSQLKREEVFRALSIIDSDGIPADARSTTYDLICNGRRYPPKLVLSLATGEPGRDALPRDQFKGGDSSRAFKVLRQLGFAIERKDFVARLLGRFMAQADKAEDLSVADYPERYCGLRVIVSFGKGNIARIPWVSFLAEGQQTNRGVYPVILYFKSQRRLAVCYGLSEEQSPSLSWTGLDAETVAEHLLRISGEKPDRYGSSYVASSFETDKPLPVGEVDSALDRVIATYEELVGEHREDLNTDDSATDVHWMFQGNPKHFDVREYVKRKDDIVWLVTRLGGQIEKDQSVFLWESGPQGGVVARGTTTMAPALMPLDDISVKYAKNQDKFADEQLRVRIRVDEVFDPPISRDAIIEHPVLRNLGLIKQPNGTNYLISKQEHDCIRELADRRSGEVKETYVPYAVQDAMHGLFLTTERFKSVLAILRSKHNVIVQGPPGVGKTFFCRRLAYALMQEKADERLGFVQFHQNYSYEDFVQGYRPSNDGGFSLKDGIFYRFCDKARKDEHHDYVFVIDEINRGNLSKIFGELMLGIEGDKRGPDWEVELAYSGPDSPSFYVPDNVYLLGLMNTADRSLSMVDYALRRRFAFFDLEPQFSSPKFGEFLTAHGAESGLVDSIISRMERLNGEIESDRANLGPGYRIGHSFFCSFDGGQVPNHGWYDRVIETEIAPLIREYWFDDAKKADELISALAI